MIISEAELQQQLRAWLREQEEAVGPLSRAMRAVYRGRGGAPSMEELLGRLLTLVARTHGDRVTATMSRLEETLERLLEDVQALRAPGATVRTAAMRQVDLTALAGAMEELSRFEDDVRRMVSNNPARVRAALAEIVAGRPPAPLPTEVAAAAAAIAAEVPPLARSLSRGRSILADGEQVLEAWRQGYTLEPAGVTPVRLGWREHPALTERMNRLHEAMERYRGAALTDRAAAARAADELQQAVSEGTESLRGFGRRFEVTSTSERVPPPRPPRPGVPPPAPGSAAADALAVRGRLAPLTADTPARELFDALAFDNLEVSATGKLGEPLPRAQMEGYALSPDDIRALDTDPPWLRDALAGHIDGWERAHLVGAGFAGEEFAGIMSAPEGVNQVAQNQGAELFLRSAADVVEGDKVGVTVRARGRRLAIPLQDGSFEYVDVLGSVHYEIPTRQGQLHFDVTVEPDGRWRATHNLPAGTAGAGVELQGTQ